MQSMTLLYEFYVTAGKLATCHTDANDFDGMALANVSTFFIFLTLLDKLKGRGGRCISIEMVQKLKACQKSAIVRRLEDGSKLFCNIR